jgi:hypothetical protein
MGRVTDQQVRKLMEEMAKHGELGLASMRAGMDRATGRKYLRMGKAPSELRRPRTWRTRPDPFAEDWPEIEARLAEAPELEGLALFEDLMARHPGRYQEGQIRTFQRRVKDWRARNGPEKEVFFPQNHRPGEALQTDFTHASELGITIQGQPFPHLLCHVVAPHSNWQWATACHSESMLALRRGVQAALFQLGRVPEFHQTDNSTAATHDLATGKRGFNEAYLALMRHFGMTPRTTGIGEKEQNGDVESANGALKRRLKQHLLLRGSRDFESVEAYEAWLQEVCARANERRRVKVAAELAVMRHLSARAFPDYDEVMVRVSQESAIRIKRNSYSVPTRLIGEQVRVRVFELHLEVWHGQQQVLRLDRLLGEYRHHIDYRHVIHSMLRKPGAFARYRHREDLFLSLTWRKAYEVLVEQEGNRRGEVSYLRLLHRAAMGMESEVEAALALLLEAGEVPTPERVKALLGDMAPTQAPEMAAPEVDLHEYDALMGAGLQEAI